MEKPNKNYPILLGKRIRTLRNLKGWTQEQLGEQADMNYKYVGEVERGQQNPSFGVLVRIAGALKVEISELFRFESQELSRKQIEKQIGLIVKSLPDEDLGRMLSVLRVLYPVR
jgi:XRE family transcriptional regulator, regulator of sulfur utilization